MGIIRVFPRRTKATPDDHLAFVGEPPLWLDEAAVREVHVSCTFTWDLNMAHRLRFDWQWRYPAAKVLIGGPAFGDAGGEFTPGMYLKQGYVITSRGCPNRCEKCLVPEREGQLRLLPVYDGHDILDNNLLACSESHIAEVLAMLRRQPQRPRFTGGLEAARMTPAIVRELLAVKPAVMYLAYDRHEQWQAVEQAARMIYEQSGWSPGTFKHYVGCYLLGGYKGDTIADADARVKRARETGFRVFPMVWRGKDGATPGREWVEWRGGILSFGGGG